jgi:3-methyladenine DNA glycosylase Tag
MTAAPDETYAGPEKNEKNGLELISVRIREAALSWLPIYSGEDDKKDVNPVFRGLSAEEKSKQDGDVVVK